MNMKMRRVTSAIFLVLIFTITLFVSQSAYGQEEKENKPVISVTVKNNKAISEATVLSKLKTKVGENFSQQVLNEDLKRLYGTDFFLDVSIDAQLAAGGVAVTVIVEEKPVIDKIVFTGNKIMSSQKLKETIKSKENEVLSHAMLTQDMVEIRKLYEKKGYQLVEVTYDADVNSSTNRAIVTVTVDEKIRVKVAKIAVVGNYSLKASKITKVLGTKPAWLFNAGAFQEEVFKEDLEKVKALYDDEGFLDAKVTPETEYSPDGKLMYITLKIDEGKKYLTGDISFKGNFVFPEKELRKQLKMRYGKVFSLRALREDVGALRQYYSQYGYMNAQVDVVRNVNDKTGDIDLAYAIDAKEVVYVGKVVIRGNTKTKDIVIRRELRVYPGEKFDGNKIKRSKERLYNLGFFEDLYFDTEPTGEPNIQDLIVNVKEAKTGEFSFGGGYSSIDLLIGFVQVTQKNFDITSFPTLMGAGQNLTLKAEIGMVRQNYLVSWTDPWFLGLPFSFGFDAYRTSHSRKENVGYAYEEVRSGGDVRLGKEFTDEIRGDSIYRLEQVEISNVIDTASQDLKSEEGKNWISSLTVGLTYDSRDNIYTPTRGLHVTGDVEDAGGIFGGDKNFVKLLGAASYYIPFFNTIVLELRGTTGIVTPYGKTEEVPIYERFFTGGANTIRGYRERAVSPRDPGSNSPIGGEAMAVGNVELTFPVYEKLLKGAVFYDVGNTWRRTRDYMSANFRSGAGIGIRVKTPLGPFKLDWGYPLSSNYEDKKEGQFYFSMTHGF